MKKVHLFLYFFHIIDNIVEDMYEDGDNEELTADEIVEQVLDEFGIDTMAKV